MSKGKVLPGVFATQDENMHRMLKKPIASTYSMTNLVSFESFVDSTIHCFFEQLDKRFVETGETCDWGTWLQYFAFDVVGEITFSKRLGFLEAGEDVDGIMGDIWHWFEYVAVVREHHTPGTYSNHGSSDICVCRLDRCLGSITFGPRTSSSLC